MTRRPRIAWVIPTLKTGGTEVQLVRLMEGLADEFELTLICTRVEGALIGDARRAGAWVRTLGLRSGWDPRTAPRLLKAFRRHTPDVVHSCLFGFDWHALHAARRANVKACVTGRRELAVWQKARHRWFLARANRLTDGILANSRAVREDVIAREGVAPEQVQVIYNGVNADAFLPQQPQPDLRARFRLPQDKKIIGMVANFSAVKDHHFLLEVVDRLLSQRNDLHFLLVGAGPLREGIAARIQRRGWDACCTIRSTATEMADLYGAMDISILCSQREGFPNALMESMAAGLPVVAPAVGGIPELVKDGQTGLLLSDRNPDAMTAAILQLLAQPERARSMGAQGAARIREHFGVQRMVGAHRDYYLNLLESKRGA